MPELTCARPALKLVRGASEVELRPGRERAQLVAHDGGTPAERSRALLIRTLGSLGEMNAFLGDSFAHPQRPQLRIVRGGN